MRNLQIDLSICILSYNNQELLRNCLNCIYKQSNQLNFEVLIVDNGSKDETASMVRREFPKVSLTLNKENRFIKAYNQALKKIKGRYFLLLNEDTELPENALKKMIMFMDKNPKIGVASCKQIDGNAKVDITCSKQPTPLIDLFESTILGKLIRKFLPFPQINKLLKKYRYSGWNRNTIKEVEVLPGPFFLGRSKLLESVGLIDEGLILFYIEADFCKRVKREGFKLFYNGKVAIKHLRGKGIAKLSPLLRFQIAEHDILYFHRKYSGISWFILLWFVLRIDSLYWRFLYKKD